MKIIILSTVINFEHFASNNWDNDGNGDDDHEYDDSDDGETEIETLSLL